MAPMKAMNAMKAMKAKKAPKKKTQAMKAMKTMLDDSSSTCSEFGVRVAEALSGKNLLHVECKYGTERTISYLVLWVKNCTYRGKNGNNFVFVKDEQILDPTKRFKDYGIVDGDTVQVIFQ